MRSTVLDNFDEISVHEIAKFPIIAVYNSPTDFKNKYVARVWDINVPTEYILVKDTLEEIRKHMPKYMHMLLPTEEDDKVIVETWL